MRIAGDLLAPSPERLGRRPSRCRLRPPARYANCRPTKTVIQASRQRSNRILDSGAVTRVELVANGSAREGRTEYFEVELTPAEIASLGLETGKRVRINSRRLSVFSDGTQGSKHLVNFQQLRIIRETVRQNFNLTEVANALYTSQSGVSKHIKDLEDELGVELFVRKGKRLLGLTEPGQELVGNRRAHSSRHAKYQETRRTVLKQGQGTTPASRQPTRRRAMRCLKFVTEFKKEFPKVNLILHEASPTEIVSMLLSGQADIGIATEDASGLGRTCDISILFLASWCGRSGWAPARDRKEAGTRGNRRVPNHHLSTRVHGRGRIDEAFANAKLEPEIVMSALDADVIKAYVELGLGSHYRVDGI